jgi:hypothetical protein
MELLVGEPFIDGLTQGIPYGFLVVGCDVGIRSFVEFENYGIIQHIPNSITAFGFFFSFDQFFDILGNCPIDFGEIVNLDMPTGAIDCFPSVSHARKVVIKIGIV